MWQALQHASREAFLKLAQRTPRRTGVAEAFDVEHEDAGEAVDAHVDGGGPLCMALVALIILLLLLALSNGIQAMSAQYYGCRNSLSDTQNTQIVQSCCDNRKRSG